MNSELDNVLNVYKAVKCISKIEEEKIRWLYDKYNMEEIFTIATYAAVWPDFESSKEELAVEIIKCLDKEAMHLITCPFEELPLLINEDKSIEYKSDTYLTSDAYRKLLQMRLNCGK